MSFKIFRNFAQVATLASAHHKQGRYLNPDDLGLIYNASIVCENDEIVWVGEDRNIPTDYQQLEFINVAGKVCLPEIVDSHTHLIFGGDRAHEYSQRLNGVSYEQIALSGGGILNTTEGTRNLNRSELLKIGLDRIKQIKSYGIGTIEIKSGYGLSFDKEYELSRVIFDLKNIVRPDIQIFNTFMAAHAIPKEFSSSYHYTKEVVLPLLEKLSEENIIDAVDVFHEINYFTEDDVRAIFDRAKILKIPIKIHADEFNDNKGAIIACEYNALSCDHLLRTGLEGISALKNSSTVATLLPGTGLFLGKEMARAREMLDAGVRVAMASDFNPGSCHCDNLILLASIAAPMYKMNQTEMWAAVTLNAAHALGLTNQGAIIPTLKARFSIFNTNSIDRITYNWGKNLAN